MSITICEDCGRTHPTDWVRAQNLFSPQPVYYRATYPDAPKRATRRQAMQDACQYHKEQTS
ncbi:hypothetical protein [Zhihengliuella flava]|uniref:Uncharacterized protein n=1 Tax=Zhihengliuella flava TaxID=1285193 RepID=A0A931DB74_9MICC|nr:hypothetical protein [Zhihengliuella flava]MBG6085837.1 hypothetical protein [Zhihengliuella flava]